MSTEIAPGWYPDPQTEGQLRYWDGNAWTEHVQPAGQPAAAAPTMPAAGPEGATPAPTPTVEPTAQPAAPGGYRSGSLEGVPAHGRERLQQLRDGKFFTSDLSVNEF